MARITVEDCILKVPNRFDLVLAAAQRARDLSAGTPLTVDRDNDKNPVVALREIAEETIEPEDLRQALIQGLQRHVEQDEPEEEELDAITVGAGLGLAAPAAGEDESLVEQEIAEEVLTVGEEAVEAGADVEEAGAEDVAVDAEEDGGEVEDESQDDKD